MPYCINCGQRLIEGARYCACCGSAVGTVTYNNQRQQKWAGTIIKCPHCGETVSSFSAKCACCGNELRGTSSSESISELLAKIQGAISDSEKIQLIRFFPIPNSKEDILEFMILAVSNFDAEYYISHIDVEDISDAWLAKIEQSYQKAKLSLPFGNELTRINELYTEVNERIQKAKKAKKVSRYRTIGNLQIVIASFFLLLVVFHGSGFGANLRIVFTSLMMIASGILTYIYINKEELKKTILISYGLNILLNFILTFWVDGHLLFFILYIVITIIFLFGTKRSDEKSNDKTHKQIGKEKLLQNAKSPGDTISKSGNLFDIIFPFVKKGAAVIAGIILFIVAINIDENGGNSSLLELIGVILLIASAVTSSKRSASFLEILIVAGSGGLSLFLANYLDNGSLLQLGGIIVLIIVTVSFFIKRVKKANKED